VILKNIAKELIFMAKVVVNSSSDLERALKQLKVRCKKEGIFKECKDRRHYLKPSARKRAEKKNRI
jgi:ribosomal protein S21